MRRRKILRAYLWRRLLILLRWRSVLFTYFIKDLKIFARRDRLSRTATFSWEAIVNYESRFVDIKVMSWWELLRLWILSLTDCSLGCIATYTQRTWGRAPSSNLTSFLSWHSSLLEIFVLFSHLLIKWFLPCSEFFILSEEPLFQFIICLKVTWVNFLIYLLLTRFVGMTLRGLLLNLLLLLNDKVQLLMLALKMSAPRTWLILLKWLCDYQLGLGDVWISGLQGMTLMIIVLLLLMLMWESIRRYATVSSKLFIHALVIEVIDLAYPGLLAFSFYFWL